MFLCINERTSSIYDEVVDGQLQRHIAGRNVQERVANAQIVQRIHIVLRARVEDIAVALRARE